MKGLKWTYTLPFLGAFSTFIAFGVAMYLWATRGFDAAHP